MSDCGGYTFAAKPTVYKGHKYASKMEARMARLLDEAKIAFKPHQQYTVVNRDGEEFSYTVDFELKRPHKFVGISKPVRFIEIKGPACHSDIDRMEALEYSQDASGFVVYNSLLQMWERCGLLRPSQNDGWR